jgi:hypothetical protein
MRVSELVAKKHLSVNIRVPPRLRAKMGGKSEYKGTVQSIVPRKSIRMVKVKTRFGTFEFRPQDLNVA